MAPPKSYMIPLQFPSGLYDYAEPPGPFANWTSAPLYSYEQFTRANPRQGREKREPRKGRARRNGPTLDRPSYPFQEMEEKYAKYTDAELHYALQDARETARHEDEMAKKGHGLAKHGWYADDVHTISKEIMRRRSGKARRNGAPEAYDVASNAGPFLPGMFPYGAEGRPEAYGPSGYEAATAVVTQREISRLAKPNGGKYADVMKHYGRAGFGIPEKAPNEGSFPLYPVKRARYALAIVAAPAFDRHPEERERVIRAAVKAHPELKKEAEHVLQRIGMRLGKRAAANGRARKNGPTLDQPHYPFAEKEKQYAKYTDAELHYALLDAREAAKHEDAMAKGGYGLSRYGWYADDVHTINAEINKRKQRK